MKSKRMLQEKEQLKSWAKEITKLKGTRKMDKRGDTPLWEIENKIQRLKYSFRHHHIACCELRGRTREQIEKPRQDNLPNKKEIERIKESITTDMEAEKKLLTMYVIVRKDVNRNTSPEAQACHAVAEYTLKRKTDWNNGTMVVLSVSNENELDDWCLKLDKEKIRWVGFKEPDLDNELTAIAVVLDNKDFFAELNLL